MVISWESLSVMLAGWSDGNNLKAIDTYCQIAIHKMKNEELDFQKSIVKTKKISEIDRKKISINIWCFDLHDGYMSVRTCQNSLSCIYLNINKMQCEETSIVKTS